MPGRNPGWPPVFLERWLGHDFFRDVVEVTIGRSSPAGRLLWSEDELLAATIKSCRLKVLRVEFDVSDARAERLTCLTTLEDLVMPQANEGLTDRGMKSISAIRTLKSLHLNQQRRHTRRPGRAGKNLDRLESLSTANMVFVQDADGVSVRGPSNTEWSLALGSFGKLHNLKVLYLALPYINGAGLSHLGKIKSLKMLEIDSLSCRDDDLRHLATLTNLQVLSLSGTTIDGTGFRASRRPFATGPCDRQASPHAVRSDDPRACRRFRRRWRCSTDRISLPMAWSRSAPCPSSVSSRSIPPSPTKPDASNRPFHNARSTMAWVARASRLAMPST